MPPQLLDLLLVAHHQLLHLVQGLLLGCAQLIQLTQLQLQFGHVLGLALYLVVLVADDPLQVFDVGYLLGLIRPVLGIQPIQLDFVGQLVPVRRDKFFLG